MAARILIIEDNQINMELMVFLLKAFGHQPLCAFDGEEGVRMAAVEKPDLIICDVHLPKLDGYGVVDRMQRTLPAPLPPLIAVTALAMVGDREKLLQAGFDGYISKPIESETFVEKIDQFLPAGRRSMRPAAQAAGAAPPERAPGTRARLLVVDDSPVNSELIRNTLEPFGYAVETADSTRAALERLHGKAFDLILSDLHMPENDGISFIRAVKADPVHAATPFVFISSSYEDDGNARLAMELGARRFLRRPIEPHVLIAEIDACIAGAGEGTRGDDNGR